MTIRLCRRAFAGVLLSSFTALATAQLLPAVQPLPAASPESVGLSAERLQRIGGWLKGEVDAKRIPGAVVMVARNGQVAYVDVVGQQDAATGAPMARDSIFRIYSMTKPIVSVAAMMLVEEGKLLLEAPVARYIPSFANAKVGIEKTDASGQKILELVPQQRPMTVQDLMRHTSGLTYGFFGDSLVKKAYVASGVGLSGDFTTAEFAEKLAALPLHYQPGSTWDYSYSTDVLGRVLEVATGESLSSLLQRRLFTPLGMRDTSFYVPEPARQARIAEPLADDRTIGVGAMIGNPRQVDKFESGGGGLVSTIDDYARFAQMLANGGALDGRRYLSAPTLAYMTADQLGPIARTPLYLPGLGYSFGLGFAVRTDAGLAPYVSPVGEFNWGGAGGTYFWVDPKNRMFVVFMMQSPKQRVPYRSVLRNMVYAAVEK